jgi:hypothetical protein
MKIWLDFQDKERLAEISAPYLNNTAQSQAAIAARLGRDV